MKKTLPWFLFLLVQLPAHYHAFSQEAPLLGKLPQLSKVWSLHKQGATNDRSYSFSWIAFTNSPSGDILSFAADRYTHSVRTVRADPMRQAATEMFPGGYPRFIRDSAPELIKGWIVSDTIRFNVIELIAFDSAAKVNLAQDALEYSYVYENAAKQTRLAHGYVLAFGELAVFVQHTSPQAITSQLANEMAQALVLGHFSAYRALLKEREDGPELLAKAKTAEERKQIQAGLANLPLRFLALAEENPKDPIALEALIQTLTWVNSTSFPDVSKDSPGQKALAILQRDHLPSAKLGLVCQLIFFGFHQSHEEFLRAVLSENPHADVQGLACLSLAQLIMDRLNRLELMKGQPELAERYRRVFGQEYLEQLQQKDRSPMEKEAEALFDRAAEKYPNVKIPVTYYGSGGTVGDKAQAELFQIRNLAVGKVAPEIEGDDQHGIHFKLSDYRGKVVLLDFWYRL